MSDSTFLTRVTLKNYKSIAECSVALHPLNFLVGPNGVGKSNFLDALRFVSDALNSTLDHAIRQRNGIKEVRRRSASHPTHFSMRLDFRLPSGVLGHYAFRIGSHPHGGFEVQDEECRLHTAEILAEKPYFRVRNGKVTTSEPVTPVAVSDRLYLVSVSSIPVFRPIYEALSRMAFYNLNPERIRDLQQPDEGKLLTRDGNNIASVLEKIRISNPAVKKRIEEYLTTVVSGIEGVDVKALGSKETLEFRQQVSGAKFPWHFPASSMSDGTLRALGVLVALFQGGNGANGRVPLIGIEEPEAALHPTAVGALLDSLTEASSEKQILITSHSPDLLDSDRIEPDSLLAVVAEKGVTYIGPIDEAGRSALLEHLYTAGELLRINQLSPDPESYEDVQGKFRYFDEELA